MSSATYNFYLNKLHVNSKTSPGDYVDKDVLVFAVIENGSGQIFAAPASNPTVNYSIPTQGAGVVDPFVGDGYIGLVESGNDIFLCAEPNPASLDIGGDTNAILPTGTIYSQVEATAQNLPLSWAVGPINIASADNITVFYSVVNLSYFKGNAGALYMNIAGAELAVLGGLTAVASPFVGAVIAGFGAILAALGSVWNDVDPGQPNCNGPILISLPQLSYSGTQLEAMVGTLLPDPATEVTQYYTSVINSGLSQESVPSKCATPSTDVYWSILRSVSTGVFGGPPPPSGMLLRPLVVSATPGDWDGTWGDGEYFQNSRVTSVISSTGNGVTGATPEERIGSYAGGLIDSIGLEPRTADLIGRSPREKRTAALSVRAMVTTRRAISTGLPVAMPTSARYMAVINEHFSSSSGAVAESMSVQNLTEIPMTALPLPPSNIYQPPPEVIVHPPLPEVHAEKVLISGASPVATTVVGAQHMALPLSFVATLVASTDVSLHLYGQFNSTGTIIAHKIRYLRTSDAGDVVTDVMLSPVQNIPT